MKNYILFVLIAVAAILSGCQNQSPVSEKPVVRETKPMPAGIRVMPDQLDQISGKQWTLLSMTVNDAAVKLQPPAPWLRIEPNGQINGNSSINKYFGAFEIDKKGVIRWPEPIGFTRMAGNLLLLNQELTYLKALPQTDRMFLTDEGTLVLRNQFSSIELVYSGGAQ